MDSPVGLACWHDLCWGPAELVGRVPGCRDGGDPGHRAAIQILFKLSLTEPELAVLRRIVTDNTRRIGKPATDSTPADPRTL